MQDKTVSQLNLMFAPRTQHMLDVGKVSWVRRKSGDTALQLLTVGKQTYSGDSRYQIEFQYPNNWRLKISRANKNDEGVYECQISTHPPKVIIYYLYVNGKCKRRFPRFLHMKLSDQSRMVYTTSGGTLCLPLFR
uniref:IGv domain-containing protein n=1 Tax=Anopheles stephensi TaxID=30069 RepID=A0A182YE09_ANOST